MRSSAAKKHPAWAAYPKAPRPRAIATSRRVSLRSSRSSPLARTNPQNMSAASEKRTASSVPTVVPSS